VASLFGQSVNNQLPIMSIFVASIRYYAYYAPSTGRGIGRARM
jgi:hypothetical protein